MFNRLLFLFFFFCDKNTKLSGFNLFKKAQIENLLLNDCKTSKNIKSNIDRDSFCIIYPKSCSYFLETYKANYIFWKNLLKNREGFNLVFLISIVSPEISIYNDVRDKFETFGLEAMYVELGSDYGDFSIGLFQMKPSFVELIENSIRESDILSKKYQKIMIHSETEKKIREIRISRIKNKVWQFEYLCAFFDIMELKFGKKFNSSREKLIFYSAAYNVGFHKTEMEIRKIQHLALFPSSLILKNRKFRYIEIVELFYDKLLLLKF